MERLLYEPMVGFSRSEKATVGDKRERDGACERQKSRWKRQYLQIHSLRESILRGVEWWSLHKAYLCGFAKNRVEIRQ